MKIKPEWTKAFLICAAASAASACASSSLETLEKSSVGEPQWAANGWLTPGTDSEPEIIGLYVTREACEAAVDEWMSRQVVGNPIHGDCLPIDRH